MDTTGGQIARSARLRIDSRLSPLRRVSTARDLCIGCLSDMSVHPPNQ